MITAQDLVEWQLRVSSGEGLPLQQDELRISGHAFEARIYAEDPDKGFLPATGVLRYMEPPGESRHVRVDTGVVQGDEISVWYDPMIAKLVTWDENRERALARLVTALSDFRISGVKTNLAFLYNLASSEPFRRAELDTHFIETHRDALFHASEKDREQDLPLASLYLLLRMEQDQRLRSGERDPGSPWNSSGAWRLNQPAVHTGAIVVNGTAHDVPVTEIGSGGARRFRISAAGRSVLASGHLEGNELYADIDGHRQRATVVPREGGYTLFTRKGAMQFELALPDYGEAESADAADSFTAPMHGVVVKRLVEAGAAVSKGQALMVMEAMKMEHTIRAPADGKVKTFFFDAGEQVSGGEALLDFES
jgi:3-methylcrotonyl-CoA carboxylase alpha subunit